MRLNGANGNITVGATGTTVTAGISNATGGTKLGELDLNGAVRTVTINSPSTLSVSAQIVDSGTGGGITVTGGGMVNLTAANTYTGGTTIVGNGVAGTGNTTVTISTTNSSTGTNSALSATGAGVTLSGGTLQTPT